MTLAHYCKYGLVEDGSGYVCSIGSEITMGVFQGWRGHEGPSYHDALVPPRYTVETIPYDRPIPETRPLVGGRLL